jgi:fumarate---(S)-2,3-diaminopropanoate ligase
VLVGTEKDLVFDHARGWFPALVPVGADRLDDLPFLGHEGARRWYERRVAGARLFVSSGTSGPPKPVAWTAQEDAWYVGEKVELFGPWLDGCRRGFVSLGAGHNAGSARLVLERLGLAVHDAGLSALQVQCAALTAFAPDVLYCSPSILANLIGGLRRWGPRPTSVRRIITNGELLLPSARALAESYFGVGRADVVDTYGSTEVGTIACTCPGCGTFHFMDGLYPEPVPAEVSGCAQPAGWGPDATVLAVSSTKRTSFPVVRLVTYDVVRGLRRSVCGGAQRFTFDCLLGRCDDVVNYGELFSLFDLADLIGRWLPGARWLVFNGSDCLVVVIKGPEPAGFRDEVWDRYPVHRRMAELGILNAPEIRFVEDFDAFLARCGLPAGRAGKDTRRVHRLRPDPSWFEDGR